MTEGKPTARTPLWWSRPAPPPAGAPAAPPPVQVGPGDSGPGTGPGTQPPQADPVPTPPPSARADAPARAEPPPAARPLHAPDPYSTPPYGGPGPWAPAPPVQRPQPTPAHGVHLPPAVAGPPAQPPSTAPADRSLRYDPWAVPLAPPPASPAAPPRRRRGRTGVLIGALLLALVAGVCGGVVGTYAERNGSFSTVRLPQAPAEQSSRRAEGSVAAIAQAVLPGVVTIHVSGPGGQGTGTGFVLDDRGHILTNHHVVRPAGDGGASGEVQVRFHSGQTADAEVVGSDAGYDLAVLRVDGVSGLHPLPLGNSASVRVGDPVVAVGAPYDLAGTVTTGIISAKERPVTAGGESEGGDVSYVNALQTDASINPGNSGGPLVDAEGRVIGINSAIRSADESPHDMPGDTGGGSIGLGFAIPVNQARRVAEELINTGRATHPVIGVSLDLAHRGDGARVAADDDGDPSVVPGGPADEAGIRAGDVVTRIDGAPVEDAEELIVRIRSHRPGDRLSLTVERDGEERVVRLTLGSSAGG
ncbi:PDZ domain-containing protein [Streptomyces sp. RKND-216]|uniref:S1C family serine protease n=1 Tax=Streptomyces sp. RKND-216 TaxID=2562581 RepID=UPI00109E081D|nr:trypsin-like peptidase domain-containing protein [Streptomyces sp. RKND-216]THA24657.1 PDZ domain-containing protein [Streptomyces sp. RKND-216]